jgi:hypothetical protein
MSGLNKGAFEVDEIRVVYLNNGVETGGFHSSFTTVKISDKDAEKAEDDFADAIQAAG